MPDNPVTLQDYMALPVLDRLDAIMLQQSGAWKQWSVEHRARYQMTQPCLCMGMYDFQDAVQTVLERPVFSDEFTVPDKLILGLFPEATADQVQQLVVRLMAGKTDEDIHKRAEEVVANYKMLLGMLGKLSP